MSPGLPTINPSAARRLVDKHGQRGWMALVEQHGKTFRLADYVVTCEPDAVRAVLMDRPHVEKRPRVHRLMAKLPGASGVLFMDGELWLKRARAVAPVFHRQNVTSAADIVHRAAANHATRWAQAGRVDDLYRAIQQLGAETVLEIGFGFDPADPHAAALATALIAYKNQTMDPRPERRVDKLHVDLGDALRLPAIVYKMWRDHARVRRALRAALDSARRAGRVDWITRLQGEGLSEPELGDEVTHLYTAFNAIDYVVTCALWELARRPALVATVRAELEQALGDRAVPGRGDLAQMPTLNGFVLEVFRRYPVTMGVVRALGAPLPLAGATLPAGTQLLVLLHALHHHPEFWDDPWEIRPERWASPEPRVPYSYVPFLLGARRCLGRDMAEQHMLLLLAAIVRRFDIAVFADAVIPPFMIPRFAAPIPFALQPA